VGRGPVPGTGQCPSAATCVTKVSDSCELLLAGTAGPVLGARQHRPPWVNLLPHARAVVPHDGATREHGSTNLPVEPWSQHAGTTAEETKGKGIGWGR
jgi:hypothetical protein